MRYRSLPMGFFDHLHSWVGLWSCSSCCCKGSHHHKRYITSSGGLVIMLCHSPDNPDPIWDENYSQLSLSYPNVAKFRYRVPGCLRVLQSVECQSKGGKLSLGSASQWPVSFTSLSPAACTLTEEKCPIECLVALECQRSLGHGDTPSIGVCHLQVPLFIVSTFVHGDSPSAHALFQEFV